jgi:beta-lactamase superfamily II metal-dependent hydrolase
VSIVKSFSTGYGDTYYIRHGSDNFTIIDCRIRDDREDIIDEIADQSRDKGVTRFISTHPDDDHIKGLQWLDDRLGLRNFYVVKNEAIKPDDTVDFERYCELRDSGKAFYISRDCSRRWMNERSDERGSSGISVIWPDLNNEAFQEALVAAAEGKSPNNISAILKYSLEDGPTMLWMGDLETNFMERLEHDFEPPKVDILFAPHHGRSRVPASWLSAMDPDLIVLGEAEKQHLEYYNERDHLRQNTAWDITFDCHAGGAHIYTGNPDYKADFLVDEYMADNEHGTYIGTLDVG